MVKNFICSLREKEYFSELVLPIVTILIIALKGQPQYLVILSPLFLVIAVNQAPRSLLIKLVEEKSENQGDLKIMGMKQKSYTIGWILYGLHKDRIVNNRSDIIMDLNGLIYQFREFWIGCELNKLISRILHVFSNNISTIFSNHKLAREVTSFIIIHFRNIFGIFRIMQVIFFILLSIFPSSGIQFAYMASDRTSFFYSGQIKYVYSLGDAAIQFEVLAIFYFILLFRLSIPK